MAELPGTVYELVRAVRAGQLIEFLHFWGHRPEADRVGAGCLSQWWPVAFEVDGLTFASAEHYMMWRKAVLFNDNETAELVLASTSPEEAKALGRQVRGFDGAAWEHARLGIVVEGNVAKFGQHDSLREYLIGTGRRLLVEASPVDRVWGIGLAADDPRAADPTLWRGLNLLGFALTTARARLS